jgi:hypothetical protein
MLETDIGAIFRFLCTEQGQLLVADLRALGHDFAGLIQKVVQKVHDAKT